MFLPSSRYASLATEKLTTGGTTVNYVSRRFLPRAESMQIQSQVNVAPDDRIDLISWRTLGDPEIFWRVCDANNAMYPLSLTTTPGRTLNIPVPGS